jgi:acyl carrier protein
MAPTLKDIDRDVLRAWMVQYISSVLDLPEGQLQTSASFASYGLDSVEAVVMAGVMEEEFRVPVDPVQFFEHHTIDDFVETYAGAPGQAPDAASG